MGNFSINCLYYALNIGIAVYIFKKKKNQTRRSIAEHRMQIVPGVVTVYMNRLYGMFCGRFNELMGVKSIC